MTEVPPDVAAAAAPAKATKKKTAVARPKKVGPSINDLIVKAVSASKERNGLSLPALKKRLDADGYDVEKNNFRIKVAIRSLLQKGTLVHTKGIGASGSFKISKDAKKPAAKAAPKAKKPAVKKPAPAIKKATPKRAKKPAAKKSSPAKKATTPKKAKKPAVVKKAVIKKSPKKVVTKKVAAKSTKKAPKPVAKKSPAKKATKSKAAKKAAPKKK